MFPKRYIPNMYVKRLAFEPDRPSSKDDKSLGLFQDMLESVCHEYQMGVFISHPLSARAIKIKVSIIT